MAWQPCPEHPRRLRGGQPHTQVCELGSQCLLGLAQVAKTRSANAKHRTMLDRCEGGL